MELYLLPVWLFQWLGRLGVSDPRQRMHFGYFLSNVLAVALLPLAPRVTHLCLLQALLGIPCPGCGVTHALLLAISLRFRESMLANPAALIIAATIAFQLFARPLAMANETASPWVTRTSRWLGKLSVVALFTAWFSTLVKLAV